MNRRNILRGSGCIAALIAHEALGSPFSARHHRTGGSAPAIAYVAPGAGWTGTAKSGGVPAVFPSGNVTADPITRSTAKPAIHWLCPSGMVLAPGEDLIIGVDADAGGMKAQVAGTISGNTLTLATLRGVTSTPTIAAAGSGGTNGPVFLRGTTGTGTSFALAGTISGGALTAISSISFSGAYSTDPTTLSAEPVTGGNLTGAQVNLTGTMATVTFGTVAIGQTVYAPGGTPAYGKITAGSGSSWTLDTSSTVSSVTSLICASLGGVKQVDFWVEGTTQTVTTPQFYTWTQNGQSKTCWGYFIKLRQSDFSAGAYSGTEARIFATAVPNDTTMQNRVIGYDLFNFGLDDGNYPLSILPRSSANDFSYTVATSNSGTSPNFTTLNAAFTQAAADGAKTPLITFTQTGNYEATNMTQHASGSKAFCTITHSPGVVATIGRAAAFTANSPTSWDWTTGWDGIEFRGSGIVFDQRNFANTVLGRASWFNGCKWTNSIGARDSLYWNNGANGPGTCGSGSVMCWADNCYSEHVSRMYLNNYYAINCQAKNLGSSIFTGNAYIYNTYVRDYTDDFFNQTTKRLSITYTDPGGHTSAKVSKLTGATTGGTLDLKVNGSIVHQVALGYYANETNPTVADVVSAINTYGTGWSAVVLNDGALWCAALIGDQEPQTFTDLNVFNTTLQIQASGYPHAEWWQGYGPNSTAQTPSARENVIIRNNVARDISNEPWLNNDDASNGNQSQDHIVKGNVVLGAAAVSIFGGAASGANSSSHYVFENNTLQESISTRQGALGDTAYCSYRNNIVGGAFGDGQGPDWTNAPPWVNNFYIQTQSGAMTGFYYAGNVTYVTFSALFIDITAGDVRPAVAGALLANKFAKVNANDGRGLAFAATDVAGAWAATETAPSYPF